METIGLPSTERKHPGRADVRASRPSGLVEAMAVAMLVSVAATTVVIVVPVFHFAYRLPEVHVATETAAALIGLLAAFLVLGRFQRNRELTDLALCYALAVLACSNLFLAVLPSALGPGSDSFGTWARLSAQLLGTSIFALAAVAPRRRLVLSRGQVAAVGLSLPVALAAVSLVVALVDPWLPAAVELVPNPENSGRPQLLGNTWLLVAQLVGVALYCVAAVGFARKARTTGDELMKWLAVASVFGAFARLNYFLYPALYTDWVYFGDSFRLAFYVAILGAVALEIRSYWETASRTAVLEERRRIARDLHDGLAQELAFIGRNLRSLDHGDPAITRIAASASRALSESRRAIAALTEPLDEPFEKVLGDAARETAEREGAAVDLALASGVPLDYERRDALIRITCEAIANAARHGRAELVRVELVHGRRVRLLVQDDGCGFDPPSVSGRRAPGFGLTSMRERTHAVGGTFEVRSSPGAGTIVEVVV